MTFDTSVIQRVLREAFFLDKLELSEEVKIASIAAYELLGGAVYIEIAGGGEGELSAVLSLISEVEVPLLGGRKRPRWLLTSGLGTNPPGRTSTMPMR